MSAVDNIVAQVLALQVRLYQAMARLEARTDPEALHDLRIAVRRIRSLTHPFRTLPDVVTLTDAAVAVGALTTPVRDLEVMIHELKTRGFYPQAQIRETRLESHYCNIMNSAAMATLLKQLDDWPAAFRKVEVEKGSRWLTKKIKKTLAKQLERFRAALDEDGFDRHQLRAMVKRIRYLTEAFPQFSPLSPEAAGALKSVQMALGDWHDQYQWCQKALVEADLRPLYKTWLKGSSAALKAAEVQLVALSDLLPESRPCSQADTQRQISRSFLSTTLAAPEYDPDQTHETVHSIARI
jgi:CHAD domain-containing protein